MKSNQQSPSNSMVLVDVGRLNAELAVIFHGVGSLFETIGTEAPEGIAPKEISVEPNAVKMESKVDALDNERKDPAPHDTNTAASTASADVSADTAANEKNTDTGTTISYDELVKILVKKIENDRANSEKIRILLNEKYSVEKAQFLPKDRYEEFLTDISAL